MRRDGGVAALGGGVIAALWHGEMNDCGGCRRRGRRLADIARGGGNGVYRHIRKMQNRFSDPALTLLLIVQGVVILVLSPLMASGVQVPEGWWALMVLSTALIAVIVSPRLAPTVVVVLAVVISVVGVVLRQQDDTVVTDWLGAGGGAMALAAVSWTVAARVFAPGRMNAYRVIGAVALYLNVALLFTGLYRLVAELSPGAFSGLPVKFDRAKSLGEIMYFSMTTLTTVGYGDIAPVHPAARSLANLEGVLGQLYPAIVLARIVTLYEGRT
jgi:hypothetical protein